LEYKYEQKIYNGSKKTYTLTNINPVMTWEERNIKKKYIESRLYGVFSKYISMNE